MFYKVIKDGKVLDVIDRIVYVRYSKRHDDVHICEPENSNAFLSSDKSRCWRVQSMRPCEKEFDTVVVRQITEQEYTQLKALTLRTPEEIIDAYTLALVMGGVI